MRKAKKNLTVPEIVRLIKVQLNRIEASKRRAEVLIAELEERVGKPTSIGLPKGWK